MKKQLLTISLSVFALTSFAKIRIVDNKGSNPKNYTSLQTAIDESAIGDTIYVAGSMTTYGDVIVGKKIVIAGEGLSSVNQRSKLSSLTFNNQLASGSKIFGLTIDALKVETEILSDLELAYNKIGSYTGLFNYKGIDKSAILFGATIYNNNWVNGFGIDISGSVFSNNFVTEMSGFNMNINDKTNISVSIVANNHFSENVTTESTVSSFTYLNFQNNLVSGGKKYGVVLMIYTNKTATVLQNNLFSEGTSFSDGIVTYSDKAPAGNYLEYIDDIFLENGKNYHLKATSKGVKAGLDGTDVGIYGGLYPWQDFEGTTDVTKFRSRFAMITGMTMKSNAPSNSTINVELKAKAIK